MTLLSTVYRLGVQLAVMTMSITLAVRTWSRLEAKSHRKRGWASDTGKDHLCVIRLPKVTLSGEVLSGP